MTKDNLLFTLIGLLTGFISGYFVHEVMAARQAPRFVGAPNGAVGAPTAGPSAPAGPAMEDIRRLQQHVAENPDDADAVLTLANLNYDIRSWDRAAELYARYLELRPEDPDVLTDLGTTLRNQGKFEEALVRFDRAQAIDSSHWQSLYNQVVIYAFDLGEMERADELLSRLESLQPGNPEVERLAAEIERRRQAPVEAAG